MNQPPPDAPVGTFKPGPPQKPASMARYKRELRREIARKQPEPEINFLNITAMLDMMTIILVFLLKSMSASSLQISQDSELKLPLSQLAGDVEKEPGGFVVIVTKHDLKAGDDIATASDIASVPQDAYLGFASDVKPNNDRSQLEIVPLKQRVAPWRQRDLQQRQNLHEDPGSEARIIADATTPYRILYEVIDTLARNGVATYHLLVLQGAKK